MKKRWYWLLVIPFVATLWLPFYAHRSPALFGFPFFYWYQLVWIVVSAGIVALVYAATKDPADG
ncbi:MAG: DUF3311 domain-containing protein [Candidatus Eremiobacteraeota bacterium]|nr:DUF3311 domain-containing protein [Candidatus Eremiobacteraeota bacterium]